MAGSTKLFVFMNRSSRSESRELNETLVEMMSDISGKLVSEPDYEDAEECRQELDEIPADEPETEREEIPTDPEDRQQFYENAFGPLPEVR